MILKLKMLIMSLGSLFVLAVPAVALAATGQSDINSGLQCGAVGNVGGANCDLGAPDTSVNKTITTAINVISIIVGVIAVIMIIVGGFRYIASGGKAESVQGAKNTILYALIGLIIVALAQIVVRFVLQKTTSATT